jgi:hypothetical protein
MVLPSVPMKLAYEIANCPSTYNMFLCVRLSLCRWIGCCVTAQLGRALSTACAAGCMCDAGGTCLALVV